MFVSMILTSVQKNPGAYPVIVLFTQGSVWIYKLTCLTWSRDFGSLGDAETNLDILIQQQMCQYFFSTLHLVCAYQKPLLYSTTTCKVGTSSQKLLSALSLSLKTRLSTLLCCHWNYLRGKPRVPVLPQSTAGRLTISLVTPNLVTCFSTADTPEAPKAEPVCEQLLLVPGAEVLSQQSDFQQFPKLKDILPIP